jgi:hypothetical protein
MALSVAPGAVAVPSQNSTGTSLCTSDAVETVTLAAAPGSGQNRYDLVVCQPRGNDLDGGANNDFIFVNVTGVAAATPTVPATPPGSVALAQIYIPGGSASVTAGNVTDVRPHGLGPEVPLAAGAALSSYTDPITSEVWVAKGGVNGGAWRKARDVLHAQMQRAAAFTATGTNTILTYDTVVNDPYGLWVTNGYTAPVAGLWRLHGHGVFSPTAAVNIYFQTYRNGAPINTSLHSFSTTTTVQVEATVKAAAGDTFQINVLATGANAPMSAPAANFNYFLADYLGTG